MAVAPSCRLYLLTPPLGLADLAAFAPRFAAALAAGDVASALVRIAPEAQGDAKRIAERMVEAAARADAAILIEGEPRLAARVGADGAHVSGVGDPLSDALASLRPERIVGVGALRGRDDAMAAGEAGADYVMFGEPRKDGYLPPFAETFERSAWWAEIFETPCVAYASTLLEAEELAATGVDFVALGECLWRAPNPEAAAADAKTRITAAALRRP